MSKDESTSDKAGSMLSHLKQMGSEISTLLKYDRTGESYCASEALEKRDPATAELGCSVLTPEQICSQLSMVLHSRGGAGPEETSEKSMDSNSNLAPASSSRKCRRERRSRKGEQPKKAKDNKTGGVKLEKRPRRRLKRKGEKRLENSEDPRQDYKPSCPPVLLQPSPYVVEIFPEKITLEENPSTSNPTPPHPNAVPSRPPSTTVPDTPRIYLPTSRANLSSLSQKSVNNLHHPLTTTTESLTDAGLFTTTGTCVITKAEKLTETTTGKSSQDSTKCCPFNYELLGRLIDEPILMTFYRSFHSCSLSEHLNICLLDPTSQGSNSAEETQIKWLQVTQNNLHVDPLHGPVTLARLLVSNSGVLKFQILFPFVKTVFTRLLASCNIPEILSELSPHHVLCPGLPNYSENHEILGFHPEDVRILQTTDLERYDHKECPIFHRPQYTTSDQIQNNMCGECLELQVSILRLIFTRLSRTEQEKQVLLAITPKTSSSLFKLPSSTAVEDSGSISIGDSGRQGEVF